jgi:hypothetical protein
VSIGVQVGAETTAGTAAATLTSVPADFSAKLVKANNVVEEVRSGQDIHFASRPGIEYEEWTVGDSAVYHDTIGLWLGAAVGVPTKAAYSTTGWATTFKFTDTPRTLTLGATQPRRATEGYKIVNAVVDKFVLSFDAEGNLTYNCSGIGKTRTNGYTPTYSFSSVTPFVAWKGQVTFNGSASGAYAKLKKGSITFTRNRKAMFTVNNVATPNAFSIGARMVEFDLTCDFVTVGEFDKYRTAATDALTIKWTHPTETVGTGSLPPTLTVKLGTVFIEDAQIDTSADLPEISVKGKALYNSTDASLAVVTVEGLTDFTTVS